MSSVADEQIRKPVSLVENLEALRPRIQQAECVALFLDFDGTISSIVPTPADAAIDPGIYEILLALSQRPDFKVSIVSGRALSDLRQRVHLNHVIYAGNHGLEIEGDSSRFREPEAEALRQELRGISLQLHLALSETDGLEIEDKGLTLAVHYRRVTEHLHDWVRSVTYSTIGRSRSFVCREGKMVLDIRPEVPWHKGQAVKWIAKEVLSVPSVVIYIGDDTTDEDAFAVLNDGVTIKVGETVYTQAQFFVPDVLAVRQFLDWLSHAKPHAAFADLERV